MHLHVKHFNRWNNQRNQIETQSNAPLHAVGLLTICRKGFSEIVASIQIGKKASDSKIN
jgi:hypothetical protein